MSALEILDRPIAFHRVFVDITGSVTAALMLSQAIYWQKRTQDEGEWFYKTQEDWQEEIGLSRYEQESARKSLKASGIFQEERRGLPAKLYFRVDTERLEALLDALSLSINKSGGTPQSSMRKTSKQYCGKPANSSAGKPQSIKGTETTTETTTKNSLSSELDDADTPEQITDIELSAEEIIQRDALLLLGYLNAKTRRNYRPVNSNLKLLLARLKEGATVDEVMAVIDAKYLAWSEDPVMNQYLRPATLFNATKFNQYVGELGQPSTNEDPVWTGRNTI